MIFVTGDTHGQADFDKLLRFARENPNLTLNDFVIIAGDFSAIWDKNTLDRELQPYRELPFTVLFADGNHENFDILNSYPEEVWRGGKVHKIAPNIIHLMRGQVFGIENITVFVFGGAASIDKEVRTEGVDWWRQEQPTQEELEEGLRNLKRHGCKVDYIITHTCCERALRYPPLNTPEMQMQTFPANILLSEFDKTVEFKHWYFGHYHFDGEPTDDMTVIYQKIIRLA